MKYTIACLSFFATLALGQTPPATLASGNYNKSLTWGGLTRTYIVHVPPAYNCRDTLPVVMVLHGAGGSAIQAQTSYRMDPVADRNGFLAVYPDGTGTTVFGIGLFTWNAVYCCGTSVPNNIDDMGFLGALLDQLPKDFKVDTNRIYASGISNGGMMSYRLGAEVSDRIAAIGVVSGAIGGTGGTQAGGVTFKIPQPARPVPVLIFHGKQDGTILYDGGNAGEALDPARIDLSVADAVDFWTKADSCTTKTSTTLASGNIVHDSHTGCAPNTSVELYTINDGSHSWPGAKIPFVQQDSPNEQISASELAWKFFAAHPLAVQPPVDAPIVPPYIDPAGVTNAASYDSGTVSPGEILSLFGSGLKEAKVWFDTTPAPVLFSTDTQINVVTPFDVATKSCVQVQAETDHKGAAVTVAVAPAGPAIFTHDASGTGVGAILNQDNTVNSQSNPAEKGSIIAIFATGAGAMTPVPTDGLPVNAPLPTLTLPVTVFLDGNAVDKTYAGSAPTLVAGALQVNAVIPPAANSGELHIVLAVGTLPDAMVSRFDAKVWIK
ncbi:MAG: PHB depolymerase family esterase [Bryobacteraceae bacterium]